jgi:hypothetical protein
VNLISQLLSFHAFFTPTTVGVTFRCHQFLGVLGYHSGSMPFHRGMINTQHSRLEFPYGLILKLVCVFSFLKRPLLHHHSSSHPIVVIHWKGTHGAKEITCDSQMGGNDNAPFCLIHHSLDSSRFRCQEGIEIGSSNRLKEL